MRGTDRRLRPQVIVYRQHRWRKLPPQALAGLINQIRRIAGSGEYLSTAEWHELDLARRRLKLEAEAVCMLSRTNTNLLDLLTDQAISRLSNREISRRTGHDHHYVAGFRAALAALKWAPPDPDGSVGSHLGPGPTRLPVMPGGPSSGTRSAPGHTIAGEPPALNSCDVWVMATQCEKERFVDAVGLQHLFDAAPLDHREHFLCQVCKQAATAAADQKCELRSFLPDLSVLDFLCRTGEIGGCAMIRGQYDAGGRTAVGLKTPRNGVLKEVSRPYHEVPGWTWLSVTQIGSGYKVHLRTEELLPGRLIVKVSKYLVAVIDGVMTPTTARAAAHAAVGAPSITDPNTAA